MVTKPTGERFRFTQSGSGLHFLDTSQESTIETTLVVNTVRDNKKNYTHNDYQRALRARELQIIMGRPSTGTFIAALKNNGLMNCQSPQGMLKQLNTYLDPMSDHSKVRQHEGVCPLSIRQLKQSRQKF